MGIVVEVIGELENFHMSREELEVSKIIDTRRRSVRKVKENPMK